MPELYYNPQGILVKDKKDKKDKKMSKNLTDKEMMELTQKFDEVQPFELAKDCVRGLLSYVGEDVDREGLIDTPRRVVEMYEQLTVGYNEDPLAIINKAIFNEGRDELVVVRDIPFYSLCEHHLAPFFGTATIGYIPLNGRVVGLSKLARVLDAYSRRLQVQERLGAQIATALYESELKPAGVGVYIQAEHFCMAMRGVQKPGTSTVTNTTLGWLDTNRGPQAGTTNSYREEWMQAVVGR